MIFSSKTPRDLNQDPLPFVWSGHDPAARKQDRCRTKHYASPDYLHDPRPEFDHVQHNAPNPILLAFRALGEKHGMAPDEVRNLAGNWVKRATYYEHHANIPSRAASKAQRDHARRVLTRLAALAEA